MVDGGYDCIDRPNWMGYNRSTMLKGSLITTTGNLTSWCTYMNFGGTVSLLIYRDNGTQYVFIGEDTESCPGGFSTHSCNISVQTGDIVGFYTSSNGYTFETTFSGGNNYQYNSTGKVNYTTLKASWSNYDNYSISLGVNVGIVYTDYYVKTTGNDSLDGLSWTNAWKTINKAATTAVDDTTVHIGFGTYDAEPAANKIAPQNVGTSGIYYLPETATTGGGTGTVSIEQNT